MNSTSTQGTVTMKGGVLTLSGKIPSRGEVAPDSLLINQDLKPIKLSSFKGKNLLILSVPSLDTSVCSMESARFNKEMAQFGNMTTIVISMDLPFAQKRWCGQEKATQLVTLSDYKDHDFGKKYGVYIQELGLLARAIFIVDQDFKIQFVHLVKEVTHEPPYEEIISQIKKISG